MRVLCCGDRNWKDERIIWRELVALPAGSVIIHGGCRGADMLCGKIARNLGFRVIGILAQWEHYEAMGMRNAAGPIRNQTMLDEHKPELVLAFHRFIRRSKGTRDMVERARKAGFLVKVVTK